MSVTHTQKLTLKRMIVRILIYCLRITYLSDVEHLTSLLEMWVEKGLTETVEARYLGNTTAKWTIFTDVDKRFLGNI